MYQRAATFFFILLSFDTKNITQTQQMLNKNFNEWIRFRRIVDVFIHVFYGLHEMLDYAKKSSE